MEERTEIIKNLAPVSMNSRGELVLGPHFYEALDAVSSGSWRQEDLSHQQGYDYLINYYKTSQKALQRLMEAYKVGVFNWSYEEFTSYSDLME